jgi:hypothetical protein
MPPVFLLPVSFAQSNYDGINNTYGNNVFAGHDNKDSNKNETVVTITKGYANPEVVITKRSPKQWYLPDKYIHYFNNNHKF